MTRTHCSNGHEWTLENTYPDGRGRRCRLCRRAAQARYRAKPDSAYRYAKVVPPYCKRGHRMTPANVNSHGRCLRCLAILQRESYWRNRERPVVAMCRNGLHELTPENVAPRTQAGCLACRKARRQRRYEAVKADPRRRADYREATRIRKHGARLKAGGKSRNWRTPKTRSSLLPRVQEEMLDAAPFLRWWEAYLAAHPDLNVTAWVRGAGFEPRVLTLAYERGTMHLDLIDKALVQAGESPATLLGLYPWLAGDGVEASVESTVILPLPVPDLKQIRRMGHEEPWSPPPGMFTELELARFRRIQRAMVSESRRGVAA